MRWRREDRQEPDDLPDLPAEDWLKEFRPVRPDALTAADRDAFRSATPTQTRLPAEPEPGSVTRSQPPARPRPSEPARPPEQPRPAVQPRLADEPGPSEQARPAGQPRDAGQLRPAGQTEPAGPPRPPWQPAPARQLPRADGPQPRSPGPVLPGGPPARFSSVPEPPRAGSDRGASDRNAWTLPADRQGGPRAKATGYRPQQRDDEYLDGRVLPPSTTWDDGGDLLPVRDGRPPLREDYRRSREAYRRSREGYQPDSAGPAAGTDADHQRPDRRSPDPGGGQRPDWRNDDFASRTRPEGHQRGASFGAPRPGDGSRPEPRQPGPPGSGYGPPGPAYEPPSRANGPTGRPYERPAAGHEPSGARYERPAAGHEPSGPRYEPSGPQVRAVRPSVRAIRPRVRAAGGRARAVWSSVRAARPRVPAGRAQPRRRLPAGAGRAGSCLVVTSRCAVRRRFCSRRGRRNGGTALPQAANGARILVTRRVPAPVRRRKALTA